MNSIRFGPPHCPLSEDWWSSKKFDVFDTFSQETLTNLSEARSCAVHPKSGIIHCVSCSARDSESENYLLVHKTGHGFFLRTHDTTRYIRNLNTWDIFMSQAEKEKIKAPQIADPPIELRGR